MSELKVFTASASPEEAAAVVAALEQFMRATAAAPAEAHDDHDGWARTAILEGVRREPEPFAGHPWINT